jgi:hypothetical protein
MDFVPTILDCNFQDGDDADYWDTLRRGDPLQPERDLMLAVLKDALLNFRKHLRNRNKSFRDDRAWFFQSDRDGLFSFESVCAVLDLNSQKIRSHLLSWEIEAGRLTSGPIEDAQDTALPEH